MFVARQQRVYLNIRTRELGAHSGIDRETGNSFGSKLKHSFILNNMSRSRPSYQQIEKLIEFLGNNPGITTGHMRSAQARHVAKMKWDEITLELNSMGGTIKDSKSWAKFWADKKYALKKLVAQRNASARRTGGGVELLQPLSEQDERLLSLLGGPGFAEGDQELSVPLNIPEGGIDASLPQEGQGGETQEEVIYQIHVEPTPSTSQETLPIQPPSSRQPPLPSTPTRASRRRRMARMTHLQAERERLIRIEEKRVEAELTNAAGRQGMTDAINNYSEKLSNAIISGVDAINNYSEKLSNAVISGAEVIADAIRQTNK